MDAAAEGDHGRLVTSGNPRRTVSGMDTITPRHTRVFVDGGWLLLAAAAALTRAPSVLREDIQLDPPRMVAALAGKAQDLTGRPVSRIHWYDGARQDKEPTPEHRALAATVGVDLTLGALRRHDGVWQQKRVDGLIQRDMTHLARTGQCLDFVLVSGDEDLAVAAEEVRALGGTVHALGVTETGRWAMSPYFASSCNDVHLLSSRDLAGSLWVRGARLTSLANSGIARVLAAS